MKLYRGTVFEGSAGRRLRIGLSFRVRWVLDDEGEPCPEDLATGFIPDLDREVTVISIRETVAGHVGQSLGGLLLRFVKAFQDKTQLPDAGSRYMSMQLISEDQYTPPAIYEPGPHTLTKDGIGTRYVLTGVRTLLDPADPADVAKARALQDAIKVEQPGGSGMFQVPKWDPVSQKKIREALLVLATTVTDTSRAFGTKDQVDPVQRLIGAASAWGANPPRDATYLNFVPEKNDGRTVYKMTIGEVPVDGFWSISLYNADGYFQKNDLNAYSLNYVTAKKNADGSAAIQFGGCDGQIPNCLPTMPGWNYMVRLYRPRAEILNGTWKFPEAQAVN